MLIKDSLLKKDVTDIIKNGSKASKNVSYRAILHVGGQSIKIIQVYDVSIHKDYNTNTSEVINVNFQMKLGDYIKEVFPNKHKLEITLIKQFGAKSHEKRYKLILDNSKQDVRAAEYINKTKEEINKLGSAELTGECHNKLFLALKNITISGSFKDITVEELIRKCFVMASEKIKDSSVLFSKVYVFPPDNNRRYKHIVVPDNTEILELVNWLQNGQYGIYNGGVGQFIQVNKSTNNIYIYPLYKYTAKNNNKVLEVYAQQTGKAAVIDTTYKVTASKIKLLGSSDLNIIDKSEADVINRGAGVVGTDSDAILKRSVKVKKDKVETNRDNYQRRQLDVYATAGGETKAKHKGITNNFYKERSATLYNTGIPLILKWNNSNEETLVPGQQVIFYYEFNKKIIRHIGILQGVSTLVDCKNKKSTSTLNIMLQMRHIK